MQLKTFVAVLHGEEYQRVIDVTAMLAASEGCHVVGVHAEPLPVALAAPLGFGDAGFIEQDIEANERRSARLKAVFSKRMDAEGISSEWWGFENYSGDSARSAVAMARAADLVVIPQVDPEAGSADMADVEALLFESGRPVLIVPYAGLLPRKIRTVLVAWNGSKESARATFQLASVPGESFNDRNSAGRRKTGCRYPRVDRRSGDSGGARAAWHQDLHPGRALGRRHADQRHHREPRR